MAGTTDKKLIVNGKRLSGRTAMDLRNLKITAGTLKNAQGSALIEWGKNKVLAGVYGPREVFPKHTTDPYKAIVSARYIMAPFCSLEEHNRSGPNRRSQEISKVAKHVFQNVVLVNQFPKTMVDIFMEVLQSDGGTRVAAVTAAGVALADAGIPLTDIPSGVSVGLLIEDGKRHLVLDLDKDEDNLGKGDMPCVVSLRSGEVLLWQMDGMLTRDELAQAFDMVFEGAKNVRAEQERALKERYEQSLNAKGE